MIAVYNNKCIFPMRLSPKIVGKTVLKQKHLDSKAKHFVELPICRANQRTMFRDVSIFGVLLLSFCTWVDTVMTSLASCSVM